MNTENLEITEVIKKEEWFSISTKEGSCFGIKTKYNVTPKVGDKVTLHSRGGCDIRGIDLNGVKLFYKTDAELETERTEWLKNNEIATQKKFTEEKESMDAQYSTLPKIFQERIDKYRQNNPRFRVDYEGYELFCCGQAVVIAEGCKTAKGVEKFKKLKWEQQKKMVKKLDDGHSGNTFGASCALAYWFLQQPENVIKMHGALAPLVGSDEYGDSPKS